MALASAVLLTLLKLGAGWISHSIGVLSEGVHSFLDLISAGIAFFTVREAGKPADSEHAFGHGKFETLSSLLESILLWVAAVLIILEGVDRLKHPHPLEYGSIAIFSLVVSLVVSFAVFRNNRQAAVETESVAIQVNALHFLADVIASAAVLIGVVVLQVTGWAWVDSFLAFGVALYILGISWRQVKKAINDLVDTQLPKEELDQIQKIIHSVRGRMINAHDLRTRRSGSLRHIEFHMVVCGLLSVSESHTICDEIEDQIMKIYPQSLVSIHVEPCETETPDCGKHCRLEKKQKG